MVRKSLILASLLLSSCQPPSQLTTSEGGRVGIQVQWPQRLHRFAVQASYEEIEALGVRIVSIQLTDSKKTHSQVVSFSDRRVEFSGVAAGPVNVTLSFLHAISGETLFRGSASDTLTGGSSKTLRVPVEELRPEPTPSFAPSATPNSIPSSTPSFAPSPTPISSPSSIPISSPTPSFTPSPTPISIKSDLTNTLGMGFQLIRAGRFQMGRPTSDPTRVDNAQHWVTLSQDFFLQTTEVTQGQWQGVMRNNPSNFKGDNLPVENVSWEEVQQFISTLNQKGEGIYRLPTEAEWEYAARAGTTSAYGCGVDFSCLNSISWIDNNSGNKTHSVGQKQPNGWGLYDMQGNVLEWVNDLYGLFSVEPVTDPQKPSTETQGTSSNSSLQRVLRGGSWKDEFYSVSLEYRSSATSGFRGSHIGFRLVRRP